MRNSEEGLGSEPVEAIGRGLRESQIIILRSYFIIRSIRLDGRVGDDDPVW